MPLKLGPENGCLLGDDRASDTERRAAMVTRDSSAQLMLCFLPCAGLAALSGEWKKKEKSR